MESGLKSRTLVTDIQSQVILDLHSMRQLQSAYPARGKKYSLFASPSVRPVRAGGCRASDSLHESVVCLVAPEHGRRERQFERANPRSQCSPVAGADTDVEEIRDLVVQHRLQLEPMPVAVFRNGINLWAQMVPIFAVEPREQGTPRRQKG
ncbi:MAG: hypothetical protein E5V27_01335 [Mesorhizobium sp.]|nr:MAG: hypothetical protein E5V27_01335 [Mesorhizobium sp.]